MIYRGLWCAGAVAVAVPVGLAIYNWAEENPLKVWALNYFVSRVVD